jgi:hypothetical protein
MREIIPRSILLALTLTLVIGAVVFIELRLDAPGADATSARANVDEQSKEAARVDEKAKDSTESSHERKKHTATGSSNDTGRSDPPKRDRGKEPVQGVSDAERIAKKQEKYTRARELTGSTGLINTHGVSIKDAADEIVVLVEFWTYS